MRKTGGREEERWRRRFPPLTRMRHIRRRGSRRKCWRTRKFLFCLIRDTLENRNGISRESIHTTRYRTPLLAHTAVFCATPLQAKRGNEPTAPPPNASHVHIKDKCGADAQGKKALTTHIWLSFLDLTEVVRKTELGKRLYAQRKETIERVFADAKEKHAMGYTHHRGLAAVTRWVRLKYVAMNLKKLALRSGRAALSPRFFTFLFLFYAKTLAFSF